MATFPFTKSTLPIVGSIATIVACVPAGDGVRPPAGRVYFPVGLAVTPGSDRLLVVNSDFDLQYAQGTVQSLDLKRVREVMQRPCTVDADCKDGKVCDSAGTDQNNQTPSFVCVDPADMEPCGPFGEKTLSARAVAPGRCSAIQLEKPADGGSGLIADVAETSAFATQGLLIPRPCQEGEWGSRACTDSDTSAERIAGRDGAAHPHRLFLPVRGDTTIHFLDIDEDGNFVCGRSVEKRDDFVFKDASDEELRKVDLRCDKSYRTAQGVTYGLNSAGELVHTDEPPPAGELSRSEIDALDEDPLNDFRLQPEPIDLAASEGGRFITVTHQVNGVVSTLMNNWVDPPALVDVLRDLGTNPLGVAAIPKPTSLDPAQPVFERENTWDFLVTYRTEARVDLLHFDDNQLLKSSLQASGTSGAKAADIVFRPTLDLVDTTKISTNSSGVHSRGLVVDDRARKAAVLACAGDSDCITLAEETPLTVYVTNRSPASLVVGQTGGSSLVSLSTEMPRFYDTIPLTGGPTRVVLGNIMGADGSPKERVFIICFDSAIIYVYDPERRRVESVIQTGRGPYALAFDPEEPVAYVAHFTDSYLGVVSLDQRHLRTFGATLATLGIPQAPRATK